LSSNFVKFCPILTTCVGYLDEESLKTVLELRQQAYMYLDEKVQTSTQAYESVDLIVRKLDEDLAKFES